MKQEKLFDMQFVNGSLHDFIDLLEEHLVHQKKAFVVTANPEIVANSKKNSLYKAALQKATYATPDGIGILKAAKLLNVELQERITGVDTVYRLLELSDRMKLSIYILGASEHNLQMAVKNIKNEYPAIQIAGMHHGYFPDRKSEALAEEIRKLKPDLVLVGLGSPKQESWIAKYFSRMEKGIFIGVGGSIDILSSEVKRAPDPFIRLHTEWLYRIITQPNRTKKIKAISVFCVMVGKSLFRKEFNLKTLRLQNIIKHFIMNKSA